MKGTKAWSGSLHYVQCLMLGLAMRQVHRCGGMQAHARSAARLQGPGAHATPVTSTSGRRCLHQSSCARRRPAALQRGIQMDTIAPSTGPCGPGYPLPGLDGTAPPGQLQ